MPESVQTGADRRSLGRRSRWKGESRSEPARRIALVSYDIVNQLLDEPPVTGPSQPSPSSVSLPSRLAPRRPSSIDRAWVDRVRLQRRGARHSAKYRPRRSSALLWLLISILAGSCLALAVFRTLGMLPVSAAVVRTDDVMARESLLRGSRLQARQNDLADARLFADLPSDVLLGSYASEFSGLAEIPISIDVDSLRYSRATLETVIAPRPPAIPTGSTLSTFAATLRPYGLKCFATNDQVVIRGVADHQKLRHVLHDVSDLLPQPEDGLDLVALITRFVDPETWQAFGGPGTISRWGDVLSISNTAQVHRDVLVFCETLRRARGLPLVSQVDLPPSMTSVREELDRLDAIQVDVYSARPRRLRELLSVLQKSCGYTFLVNWNALEEDTPLRFEECWVAVPAEPMNLHEVLRRLVAQLGVTLRSVSKHTIEITSAAEELRNDCIVVHRLPRGFEPTAFTAEVEGELIAELPVRQSRFWIDAASRLMICRLPQSRQIAFAEWLARLKFDAGLVTESAPGP